jgi:hypothetical protein
MNCGDWVESCTALAENADGSFELLTWIAPGDTLIPVPENVPAQGVPVAA